MSMKKFLLSTLLISSFLTLSSCGDKKGGRNDLSEKEEVEKDSTKGVVVTLEGVFPTNDVYQLFYSTTDQYDEKKSLHVPVYGQQVLQKVVFEIPEGEKPLYIRVDMGSNPAQTIATIKEVKFSYNENDFKVDNKDVIGKFFVNNPSIEYNPVTLSLNLKADQNNVYDPFMISNDELKKSLNKLYSSNSAK
ncbi:hypothetical protein ACTS9U_11650 [Empedobacter falsenii]